MNKDVDDRIVCEDKWGTVEYAVRFNGSLPAKDDLKKIEEKHSQNYRWLNVLFMRMAQLGRNGFSKSKFDAYEEGIFKFKRHPYRVACFFVNNRCLLTHVFDKKSGK